MRSRHLSFFFFFNDTATTEIYTPFPTRRSSDLVSTCAASSRVGSRTRQRKFPCFARSVRMGSANAAVRSEEHTSELQSRSDLVCRLLLEKKKTWSQRPEHTNRMLLTNPQQSPIG